MVAVAQLVRARGCEPRGYGFEFRRPPQKKGSAPSMIGHTFSGSTPEPPPSHGRMAELVRQLFIKQSMRHLPGRLGRGSCSQDMRTWWNGRHVGLRRLWGNTHEGSNPFVRTRKGHHPPGRSVHSAERQLQVRSLVPPPMGGWRNWKTQWSKEPSSKDDAPSTRMMPRRNQGPRPP